MTAVEYQSTQQPTPNRTDDNGAKRFFFFLLASS
jgi:hypothetical protein